ncbi:branched-chain amino acid ABC transporter permease [Lacrimispora sp. NSJ-141]|uniref:Branched-chain amino acid ABC transporter permease n=1 Tax=Lientehia hominis TaxID=2897778 RepID=A0AAP2WAQ6_9FIRM|nr:branched-chain amino acid ABC transporter permease [Lientehia hominis]MCD2493674.1 branched-chain amino acid ABC transporter permease [Lientehia hominis]
MNVKRVIKTIYPAAIVVLIYVFVTVLRSVGIMNGYYNQILMFAGINIMMTASLNLVNGFTGQFCIGHAGFMSLGAYGAAVITTMVFGNVASPPLQILVFLLGLIMGGIVAMLAGVLIGLPSLKLKGDYLAIVTLAFGEIVRALLRLVKPIGGARGMIGIPGYANLGWILFFMALTLFLFRNLIYSPYGRAFISIRDNEVAADAMGINTTRYKMTAFCIAAFVAGVAGGLYAHVITFIQPDNFSFTKSADFLVYLYAGGSGSLTGSVVGATLLTILPEFLRFLSDWRLVVYAVILVIVMLYRSEGICGGWELPFMKIKRSSLYEEPVFGGKKTEGKGEQP